MTSLGGGWRHRSVLHRWRFNGQWPTAVFNHQRNSVSEPTSKRTRVFVLLTGSAASDGGQSTDAAAAAAAAAKSRWRRWKHLVSAQFAPHNTLQLSQSAVAYFSVTSSNDVVLGLSPPLIRPSLPLFLSHTHLVAIFYSCIFHSWITVPIFALQYFPPLHFDRGLYFHSCIFRRHFFVLRQLLWKQTTSAESISTCITHTRNGTP